MNLIHKSTGVKFQFIEYFTPQFTNQMYVRLLNLKSGKNEQFLASTYNQYFEAE